MTAQELLDLFNRLIANNRWWNRFANSQFIRMMAVFGSQIIYIGRAGAEKSLPEGFISTATKRTSILAAAEDKGYIPRLITPSEGPVTINNKSTRIMQLPVYMTIWGENQYPYVLTDIVTLSPGEVKSNLPIQQKEKITVSTEINKGEEFFSILLSKEISAKTVSLDVFITLNGIREKWDENPQFRLANKRSKNYVRFYKPTEQIGVRFGDGSIGMIPPDNCTIDVEVWVSEGDLTLVQGQRLTPSGNYQALANDLEIITAAPITNGAGMESTEETRNRAMYSDAYDEQIVWDGDYKAFLTRRIPQITWLNVWGEAEEELANGKKDLANINTIFMTGHRPGWTQAELETQIKVIIDSIPNRLNKKFKYYSTNEKPFSIEINGKPFTEVIIADAVAKITTKLTETFGKDAASFNSSRISTAETVKQNDIWAAIQSLNLLSEFTIKIVNPNPASQSDANQLPSVEKLFDFVYMDVSATKYNISSI